MGENGVMMVDDEGWDDGEWSEDTHRCHSQRSLQISGNVFYCVLESMCMLYCIVLYCVLRSMFLLCCVVLYCIVY